MPFTALLRTVFTLGKGLWRGLPEPTADRDPMDLFNEWFTEAVKSGLLLPEAATLATCTKQAVPSARIVLIKQFNENGFIFYNNYSSRKAEELEENPRAALVYYWPILQRQVRIEGIVSRVTKNESEAYFHSRPRGSQLGAWASKQSKILANRQDMDARFQNFKTKFKDSNVPLPKFWGGYRVTPQCIEFWQGRANRLHDRLRFDREVNGWASKRLYP